MKFTGVDRNSPDRVRAALSACLLLEAKLILGLQNGILKRRRDAGGLYLAVPRIGRNHTVRKSSAGNLDSLAAE
jgi:hypothetical protein